MSDQGRAPLADGEAPVNPYSLLEAVNASSDTAHTGWLIFIGILSYLLVAVAGVSHKDLLLSRDIPLPILQVGIELTRFFLFAPFVIVLFHVGLITQLVMLARKTIELDGALRIVEATDKRSHPLRLELNNFFFVQAIAGPERSAVVNGLLHGLSWLTLVVLPVLVLLYIQLAFLPYHDETTTWAHRIALVADIGLLALIGVFLSRPEPSLASALWRATRAHPVTGMMTVVVLASVAAFSFLVATIPGETLDRLSRRLWPSVAASGSRGGEPTGASQAGIGFALPFVGASADGKLFGLFERNLNVTDFDLVIDKDVTPGEPTLNLRRRDLRYARLDRTDLHQADLTGADLEGASLVGADLRGALIQCADVSLLLLSENRVAAGCSRAPRANFTKARLGGASLSGLDLTGARLEEADLTGGNLSHALLDGANLYGVRARGADLTGGVPMRGANLATAELQGADLTGVKLHGADLTSAGLQGAVLEFASLDGATLRDADLEGASLFQARLHLSDLSGANVRAASFREARIWRTRPPASAGADLVDLGDVQSAPPNAADATELLEMLTKIADQRLAARLRDVLGDVLKPGQADVPDQATPEAGAGWRLLVATSTTQPPEPRPVSRDGFAAPAPFSGSPAASAELTTGAGSTQQGTNGASGSQRAGDRKTRLSHALVGMACRTKWSDGSVATGLAKRAASPAFNGDAVLVYDGLRQPTCPSSGAVPTPTLARLAKVVEPLRGR